MSDFSTILSDAVAGDSCLLLVLSKPSPESPCDADKLKIRPIRLRGERSFQFAYQRAGRETHENLDTGQTLARVAELFPGAFQHGHLYTSAADYAAAVDADGDVRIRQSPPTRQSADEVHNRSKHYLIPDGVPCPFLAEIGVMTPSGKVRASRFQKFRQVNRFLELVGDVLSALPAEGELTVVDFGCGKSYLSFALDHLLCNIYGRQARIIGLDRNAEIVGECRRIAERLDCRGLDFRVGDIADFQTDRHIDLVISLHACDTATDDALAQAVRWRAEVILAVPCCQRELNARMDRQAMPALTEHGILQERLAALATDALRAEALEICGYKTQVVEFIDMEHTAKNILIRGVRRHASARDATPSIAAYRQLKQFLGLEHVYLEEALGPEFAGRIEC